MDEAMTEREIQKAILEYLGYEEKLGRVWGVRVNSGMVKSGKRFIHLGRAGTPDILCCIRGRFVGFEVKNEKGKQEQTQKEAQLGIERAGGRYLIVRSVRDVERAVGLLTGEHLD